MPEFTIIVPVYNVERYLERCIKSVLDQTYSDFELILVDDGSTDGCGAICDSYAANDVRIKVIHKENGGVSTARNTGIEAASGRYITFCDSDDYYKETMLEAVAAKLDAVDADILCFNYDSLCETGIKRSSNIDTGEFKLENPEDHFSFIIKHTFTSFLCWSMCTSFYKAELIRSNDFKICENCHNYAEDIGFSIKAVMHASFIVGISDSLYVYDRTRENSMMNSGKGIYKFNDVNEVAFDVWNEYKNVFGDKYSDYFAIIFFQLMYGEYVKMIWQNDIRSLPDEVEKINKQDWYTNQTKQVITAKKRFYEFYSKKQTGEYMAMCRYCLTGSYIKYHLDCWINNLINRQK